MSFTLASTAALQYETIKALAQGTTEQTGMELLDTEDDPVQRVRQMQKKLSEILVEMELCKSRRLAALKRTEKSAQKEARRHQSQ